MYIYLHRAYITFRLVFLKILLLLWSLAVNNIKAQSYFDRPEYFKEIRDWRLSASLGGEARDKAAGRLYSVALAKHWGGGVYSLRYTPGLTQSFSVTSSTGIIAGGNAPIVLGSEFNYSEPFAVSSDFRFSDRFGAGASFRYFSQKFTNDELFSIFDTLNQVPRLLTQKYSDEGYSFAISPSFRYFIGNNLSVGLTYMNLIRYNSQLSEGFNQYRLKIPRVGVISADLNIMPDLNFSFESATDGSFRTGGNFAFNLLHGNIKFSALLFHDKYQQPFIAGILPGVSYSYKDISVSVSGVGYFSERSRDFSFNEFRQNGLNDIMNNRFNSGRILLNIDLALDTRPELGVKFIDVKVTGDIYPALDNMYIDVPFAYGKVVNLSGRSITIRPASFIRDLGKDLFQSPPVSIAPHDTAEVPFYTSIDTDLQSIKKTKITQAVFYITGTGNESDEFRVPVLVNDQNSWDGSVSNLRYFVKQDFNFSLNHTKAVLSRYKIQLDTLPSQLKKFYMAGLLFNEMASSMVYVADPLASADRVQYPSETIRLRGGDCDDLSVAYASLLESVGIETAFIDYRHETGIRHVSLLLNTELAPEEAPFITMNDRKYYLRKNFEGKDEIWLPIETTLLTGFYNAWETGAEKFYTEAIDDMGLAKGDVAIVEVY